MAFANHGVPVDVITPSGDNLSLMLFRVATWNTNHWQRSLENRERTWAHVAGLGVDAALLQEWVPPRNLGRERVVWRELGGSRRWGSAIVTFGPVIDEVTHARSRYAQHAYALLNAQPGAVAIARAHPEGAAPVTLVSVYGVMDPYVQTTLFRIVADLIPLFDSADGRRVVLGGDLNLTTAVRAADELAKRNLERYRAILHAVESLGLVNLFRAARSCPQPTPGCPCDGSDCYHVQTHRNKNLIGTPHEQLPGHLDYLFASPDLARACTRIWLDDADPQWQLSDHRAVLAEFELADAGKVRAWDEASFTTEVRRFLGDATAHVVEVLLAWGERHRLRLHFEDGTEGQVWFQLDDAPIPPQYTFSIRTRGELVFQFQHMKPPFADQPSREELRRRLNQIPGVGIDSSKGRPSIPLKALSQEGALAAFVSVFDDVLARTRAAVANPKA